ncbi:MAG TPA: hypothetical protein VFS43_00360 [Polyangiaceae bacterium]|nr:hypothetical protein [Polyangiaceae bacterium]
MRLRRPLALAAWCALALGPLELALHLAAAARAPDELDWARARASVEARRREGDLVVASPRWAEPHARRAFGEGLMPLRDVARPDETGYARALEVAAPGGRDGAVAGWRLLDAWAEGRLSFRLWENPSPERFVFDFVDEVEAGRAEVFWALENGDAADCPFADAAVDAPWGQPGLPARRYVCDEEPRHSVAVTVIDDLGHRPRRCVVTPPPPQPWREVVVRVRGAPPSAGLVAGHMGLPYLYEREGVGAPVELVLRAGGDEIGALRHRDGEGWARFAWPIGGRAAGAGGLSIHVSGAGAEGRPLCWEARLR